MQFITTKCSGPVRLARIAVLAGLMGSALAAQAQQASAPAPAATAVRAAPALSLEKLDFKRGDDGAGKLIIRFSGEGAAPDLRTDGGRVVVELGSVQVPATLQRAMSVTDFATPVDRIDTGSNRLVLTTKGAIDSMAYQHGREYIVEVTQKASQTAVGGMSSVVATAAQRAAAARTPVYTGRPVNFNFQDVPVRTVLQLIAETSGLNVVASDTVQGNITLRMVNVPWDKALDVILKSKGLDKRRDGNVIWVAPQAEIAKSEQEKEDARIALENRQDLVTEYFRINYHNATEIYKALTEAKGIGGAGGSGGGSGGSTSDNGFLSPRGRLVADSRTNTLMISDIPKKVDAMRQLINEIDRPVDQVVIEARIVIATESFARDLGAKFGVGFRAGNYGIGSTNTPVGSAANTEYPAGRGAMVNPQYHGYQFNLPAATTNVAAAVLGYSILGTNFSLDFELSAMQQEGRGEVLSNPRIFTTNQRESVIQQGKELPYVTVTNMGGVVTQTVAYKQALLELRVTPTITNDDRVFLVVKVNKDELDSYLTTTLGQIPIIAKRQVDTAVLMDNGQTVVIGGVYEFTDTDSIRKVPFLGDIPFLGNLFKQKSKQQQKAELLVFLTPRIIRVKQQMH